MVGVGRILVFVLLLIFGAASAREGKGWLGADVLHVTKTEADKLKWDAPRGAMVGVVASGSPRANIIADLREDWRYLQRVMMVPCVR